jgi:hypothetical protein
MPGVIHSRPEFKGLHKSGHNLPLAVVDVWCFEPQTARYKFIIFGIKGFMWRQLDRLSSVIMWCTAFTTIITTEACCCVIISKWGFHLVSIEMNNKVTNKWCSFWVIRYCLYILFCSKLMVFNKPLMKASRMEWTELNSSYGYRKYFFTSESYRNYPDRKPRGRGGFWRWVKPASLGEGTLITNPVLQGGGWA